MLGLLSKHTVFSPAVMNRRAIREPITPVPPRIRTVMLRLLHLRLPLNGGPPLGRPLRVRRALSHRPPDYR